MYGTQLQCLPLSCMRFLIRSRGCTNTVADILDEGWVGWGEGAKSNELLSPMTTTA